MVEQATSFSDRIESARGRLDDEIERVQKRIQTRRKQIEKQINTGRKNFEKQLSSSRKSFEKQTRKQVKQIQSDLRSNDFLRRLDRLRADAGQQLEDAFEAPRSDAERVLARRREGHRVGLEGHLATAGAGEPALEARRDGEMQRQRLLSLEVARVALALFRGDRL